MSFNTTKEELYDLYWNQELSTPKIAAQLGCTGTTVRKYMGRFGIPRRSIADATKGVTCTEDARKNMAAIAAKRRAQISKDELHDLYWNEGYGLAKIGELIGRTAATVLNYMVEYNIPRRTSFDANRRVNITKGELYDLYVVKEMTTAAIGKSVGCHPVTISDILHKYEIPVRNGGGKKPPLHMILSKEELYDLYWNDGLTCAGIAKIMGYAQPSVSNLMKKYGIPQKTFSELCSGVNNPMYGVCGKNNPNWQGGTSFEPYCPKFNESFKELIREKFGRICFLCPTTEEENGKKLAVHHVNYNKDCLCDGPNCEFVPLCNTCHGKTNFNRDFWTDLITSKLNEIKEVDYV